MNELQKRFEEMQERLERTIRGQRDTIALYKENNNKLRSLLSWRKVEELPEKSGRIIACLGKSNEPITGQWNVFSEIFDADDGEIYSKRNIKNWLPIPKLEKEEV